MTEHEVCKNCKFNHYPECYGTILSDGSYMKIDDLRVDFACGQKLEEKATNFVSFKNTRYKVFLELENRVEILENKKEEIT